MNREVLHRFFRCQTTPYEEQQIMNWVEASDANKKIFDAEHIIFDTLAIHAPDINEKGGTAKKRVGRLISKYIAGAAAVMAIAFGTGYFMRANLKKEIAGMATTLSVPTGQRMNVVLNDGTQVWLNSNTELEYPPVFGKERRVRLNGEAMFDVEHDADRPFIVETFLGELEVLGTKFNVEAYEEAGIFETSLLEGKLKVVNKLNHGEQIIMMPDNVLTLVGNRLSLKIMDTPHDFLWTEGIISFEHIAFDELMKQFEKYYDVTIRIERETLPRINYTRGKIRIMDGVDHAMKALQYASDFTYTKDEENRLIIIK